MKLNNFFLFKSKLEFSKPKENGKNWNLQMQQTPKPSAQGPCDLPC